MNIIISCANGKTGITTLTFKGVTFGKALKWITTEYTILRLSYKQILQLRRNKMSILQS